MSRARSPGESVVEARRHDHRRVQPRAQPRRRRLGAVRAQPLQFPQRLLGQGAGQAGASRRRRDRQRHPPDARRQGRERAADRRLSVANNSRHPRHRRRDRRAVRGRGTLEACAGDRARGGGADRLPLVGPQRDHASLCARRPAGPRADARQPVLLRHRRPRVSATFRSAIAMPVLVHAREDEREALDALERGDLARSPSSSGSTQRGVHELCPLLKDDARHGIADRNGIRLDPHALLQGNLRQLRSNGRRAA